MKCNRLIESFPWEHGYRITSGECHIDHNGDVAGPVMIRISDSMVCAHDAEDLAAVGANRAIIKMLDSVDGY